MNRNQFEESAKKEAAIKLATLIEIKQIFSGNFPVTESEIDDKIDECQNFISEKSEKKVE